MGTEKRTRTLVIEETELGVRITAAGSRYVVRTGSNDAHNLSTVEISDRWITDFAPGEEDRAAYAAKHCSDNGLLHPREGCDGLCHDNCSEPADVFEHHKRPDGTESSLPYCKSHAQDMAQLVGRAVLFAVDFGIVHDLRFWNHDILPDGSTRCDHRYRAVDDYGLTSARCTRTATKKVRITDGGEVYEANVCPTCLARSRNSEKLDVLGDVAVSTRSSADANADPDSIPATAYVAHICCPYEPSLLRRCERPMIIEGGFVECGKPAWHKVERLHGDLDGWYCCKCYAELST